MSDEERVVQQGVGWFLREAWKKDRNAVEPFLAEWKDTAPRLIFQYATEKMSKTEKERFRADKRSAAAAHQPA
jgi:3-methyladenine DNA glycosylase AlkD